MSALDPAQVRQTLRGSPVEPDADDRRAIPAMSELLPEPFASMLPAPAKSRLPSTPAAIRHSRHIESQAQAGDLPSLVERRCTKRSTRASESPSTNRQKQCGA